jgi:2-amino-4-hydroxy-6-hydroxymethyldihydropteridine diphosphokinase
VNKAVYLSLGSNLGDREANLRGAVDRLKENEVKILGVSSIYETEPQDIREQPWFLNIALHGETHLFPMQLLSRIRKIQLEMAGKLTIPKGPRIIDIDILLFGNFLIETPDLTIPHPRMSGRRFVLEPLLEIAPDLRHPRSRRAMREMLPATQGQGIKKLRAW